jgi:hypothetical protein
MSSGNTSDTHAPRFDYAQYLEAKAPLDSRCRNPRVWSSFLERARVIDSPRLLDLGTGTGMLLRTLIGTESGFSELWGLEQDGVLCRRALRTVSARLKEAGYSMSAQLQSGSGGRISAQKRESSVTIVIRQGDALDPASLPEAEARFDCVTANAFLDLVPLGAAVERLHSLLREHGLVYAAINYDGVTSLFPACADQGFEDDLIEQYNRSMDAKRPEGTAAGGSRTGTLLIRELQQSGFSVLDAGPSDWVIFAGQDGYGEGEIFFLNCILSMICSEGRAGGLAGNRLDRWLSERRRNLEEGVLGLLTHQIDVLASRCEGRGRE